MTKKSANDADNALQANNHYLFCLNVNKIGSDCYFETNRNNFSIDTYKTSYSEQI